MNNEHLNLILRKLAQRGTTRGRSASLGEKHWIVCKINVSICPCNRNTYGKLNLLAIYWFITFQRNKRGDKSAYKTAEVENFEWQAGWILFLYPWPTFEPACQTLTKLRDLSKKNWPRPPDYYDFQKKSKNDKPC